MNFPARLVATEFMFQHVLRVLFGLFGDVRVTQGAVICSSHILVMIPSAGDEATDYLRFVAAHGIQSVLGHDVQI